MCEPVAFHQQSLQKVTYSHTPMRAHTQLQPHKHIAGHEGTGGEEEQNRDKGDKVQAACGTILPAHMRPYTIVNMEGESELL